MPTQSSATIASPATRELVAALEAHMTAVAEELDRLR
jgi:hypothetical protein